MKSSAAMLAALMALACLPEFSQGFLPVAPTRTACNNVRSRLHMSSSTGGDGAAAGRARGVPAALDSFRHNHDITVQAKASTSSAPAAVDAEDDVYGDEEAMMAEARERVASAMKTGSLVDPAERIRLQQQRNQPGSARGEIFANLAVLGVLVGSVYFAGKSYFTRQETLVEGYASEMTDVISSSTEMDACHKEYKRKLGPKQFRGEMFAAFITELARKKPITCQTMMAADYVRRKFGFKDVKVAKLLAAAGQAVARKQPGLRSKLLFYGQRLSGSSDAAAKQLQPLKDLLAQSYRSGGAQIVESASISIAEQALRDSAHASGELPEGWELLGMSEAQARETLGEGGGEAVATNNLSWSAYYTQKDDAADVQQDDSAGDEMYAKLVKEAKDRDAATEAAKGGAGRGGGSSEEGTARAFECGSCGYTLYVAKGREWKFFGDDFKCPECGASKGKFQEKGVGGTGEP